MQLSTPPLIENQQPPDGAWHILSHSHSLICRFKTCILNGLFRMLNGLFRMVNGLFCMVNGLLCIQNSLFARQTVTHAKWSVLRNTKIISHTKRSIPRNIKLAKQNFFFWEIPCLFCMKFSRNTKQKKSSDNPIYAILWSVMRGRSHFGGSDSGSSSNKISYLF